VEYDQRTRHCSVKAAVLGLYLSAAMILPTQFKRDTGLKAVAWHQLCWNPDKYSLPSGYVQYYCMA
jgi:hypothetical protein